MSPQDQIAQISAFVSDERVTRCLTACVAGDG